MLTTDDPTRDTIELLVRSGQVERSRAHHETVLDRGCYLFVGILLGLALAWLRL